MQVAGGRCQEQLKVPKSPLGGRPPGPAAGLPALAAIRWEPWGRCKPGAGRAATRQPGLWRRPARPERPLAAGDAGETQLLVSQSESWTGAPLSNAYCKALAHAAGANERRPPPAVICRLTARLLRCYTHLTVHEQRKRWTRMPPQRPTAARPLTASSSRACQALPAPRPSPRPAARPSSPTPARPRRLPTA